MSTPKLQPFDNGDWNAFCGAMGDNPLVCYEHTIVLDNTTHTHTAIIVDDSGLEFYLYDENYSVVCVFGYHPAKAAYNTGKFMAECLVWDNLTSDGLLALGFEIMA